jgi:NADPH-dependent curcumin reductase CurA
VLIRNEYLSLDAGTRMYMNSREDSYSPPSPLGAVVIGMVLGTVVESRHPDYLPGDFVRAYGQWSDYSVSRPDDTYVVQVTRNLGDPRQHLAVFGPNGWTAYLGITQYGAARAGETVVISAAAGATGLLAGQIARRIGCRVVGISGSDEKCRWLQSEFKFDGVINYRKGGVSDAVARQCPKGVDVYFDNVGGDILDAVLPNMALYGRVAVCGLISLYDKETPVPGPYKFDMVLMKRLNIVGFFSPDFYEREKEINRKMRPWFAEGAVNMVFDETVGLENTLGAYSKLFTGANRGKVLVKMRS